MYLEATKTDLQRHDEEAERLIRQSPKVKPPRHDLRRERIDTEEDQDRVDVSDRKDRSRNFKDIGGAVQRLVHRARTELIPARSRETGKVVKISPDTLKERPGEYEVVDPDQSEEVVSEKAPPEGSSDGSRSERTQVYQQAGQALRELAKSDPKLSNKLKDFARPDSQIAGLAKENPDFPAAKLFPGVTLPKGLNTLGDIREALANSLGPSKKQKKQKGEKPAGPTKKPSVPEVPKEEDPTPSEVPDPPKKKAPPKSKDPESSSKKKPKAPEAPEEGTPTQDPVLDHVPTKAELYQIAKPQRREVFPEERQAAITLLVDTFPPHVSSELIAKNLHPDDVRELVRNYSAAKVAGPKNLDRLVATAVKVYQTDPDEVEPPLEGRNAKGSTVPFDQLTPEEQAEATLTHQLQVSALSLAARDILTEKISQKGALSGKPRIPIGLASSLAEGILRPPDANTLNESVSKTFRESLDSSEFVSPKAAKSLLAQVSKYPGAKQLATAYLQAADYGKAKAEFLDKAEISEWNKPKEIVRGLSKAESFFRDRNKVYETSGEHPSARLFRQRVINRLNALDPVKAKAVRGRLVELEKAEYAYQHKAWQKAMEDFLARKQEHAQAQAEYLSSPQGKTPPGPFLDSPPKEPLKPAHSFDSSEGMALWSSLTGGPKKTKPEKTEVSQVTSPAEDPEQLASIASKAWADAQEDRTKAASVVGRSTYLSYSVMDSSAKTSVYHGIDPKKNRSEVGEGWTQFIQRDFSEKDVQAILASAKSWLDSPLLTVAVNDMVPDSRFRAALDLALYTGPYNGAISANVYNDLLAKLIKVGEPGLGNTLLTKTANYRTENRFLAVYGPTPVDETVLRSMESRKFAFRDASGATFVDGTVEACLIRQGSVGAGPGYVGEALIRINFPEGSSEAATKAATEALEALRLRTEIVTASYIPSSRTADESSFIPTPNETGSSHMTASSQLRKLASQAAKLDSKLALELVALADRLGEDRPSTDSKKPLQRESSSRYASLRSLIIRQAFSVEASQRTPWMPVLQALKDS